MSVAVIRVICPFGNLGFLSYVRSKEIKGSLLFVCATGGRRTAIPDNSRQTCVFRRVQVLLRGTYSRLSASWGCGRVSIEKPHRKGVIVIGRHASQMQLGTIPTMLGCPWFASDHRTGRRFLSCVVPENVVPAAPGGPCRIGSRAMPYCPSRAPFGGRSGKAGAGAECHCLAEFGCDQPADHKKSERLRCLRELQRDPQQCQWMLETSRPGQADLGGSCHRPSPGAEQTLAAN